MINVRFKLFILTAFVLLSCKGEHGITVPVHEVDYLNRSESVIHGSIVPQEFIGANTFTLFDTLLMVMSNNPAGLLSVYSTNTLSHLGTFCQKGRARNEFQSDVSFCCRQAYIKDGHVILPLAEYPKTLKLIDVTASIDNGGTVVTDVMECLSMDDGIFVILDDDYANRYEFWEYVPMSEQDDKVPTKYYLYRDNNKKELIFFNELMKSESKNTILPYLGNLYKHPYKNKVVQSFERLDYLLYMDYDTENYFAVHQKGSLSFDDTFPRNNDPRTALYFSAGTTSDQFVMFLYRHGDYTQKVTVDNPMPELLVFDWDGNFICSYKVDQPVRTIVYDEIHKMLYGVDASEHIYAYDLGSIANLLPK